MINAGTKTYSARKENIEREWYVVDAKDKILGRLSTEIAKILCGKHKPIYTPHVDCGDYVIVINADKIKVTGKKMENKKYYRHSGYVGKLKVLTLKEMLQRSPCMVLRKSIEGMLPKNRLGRAMIKKLKIYSGDEHPHQAQKPKKLEI